MTTREGPAVARELGSATGVALVGVIGLVAGIVTYITERIFCAVAPSVPLLSASCDTDSARLAVVVGLGAGAVSLVGLLVARRRGRRRDGT